METETEDENPGFVIEQDQSQNVFTNQLQQVLPLVSYSKKV
jgi:hypothetical protein